MKNLNTPLIIVVGQLFYMAYEGIRLIGVERECEPFTSNAISKALIMITLFSLLSFIAGRKSKK